LDIPLELSRSRTIARGRAVDRLEAEDDGFYARVRDGFLALARGPRYRVLDGTQSKDELIERALREVDDV
jgi:thymidylate kinase